MTIDYHIIIDCLIIVWIAQKTIKYIMILLYYLSNTNLLEKCLYFNFISKPIFKMIYYKFKLFYIIVSN